MEVNKEMWATWRRDPVTQLFFTYMKTREQDAIEHLVGSEDPLIRGFIQCYREVLNVSFEETTDDSPEGFYRPG